MRTKDHQIQNQVIVLFFWFLSGYFFNPEKSAKSFFASKAKSLLLPFAHTMDTGLLLYLKNILFVVLALILLTLLNELIIKTRLKKLIGKNYFTKLSSESS